MLLLICNRELMFILSEKHRQDNAPQGCTTILIGIMSTELTRIVCQILAEQDLIIRERMKTIWRNQQRLMKKEYVHLDAMESIAKLASAGKMNADGNMDYGVKKGNYLGHGSNLVYTTGLELRRQSLQNGRMYHWILSKVLKMAEGQ